MPPVVTLRRVSITDTPSIYRWRIEPSTGLFQPTLPLTLEEVRRMLAERSATAITPTAAGMFQWIVETTEGPAGWISLHLDADDRRHGKATIGYTIGERFRGRGYGSAALGALLPIAFSANHFALARLEAVAAITNHASRRVLERNGFHFEGILRGLLEIGGVRVDHAIYGLLRTDWEDRDAG